MCSSDLERGLKLARSVASGMVHVNDQTIGDEAHIPFGGVKDSGVGRFGGRYMLDEFTDIRWLTVQTGHRAYPI